MARFSRTPWMSRVASMPKRRCSPRPRESSFWLDATADADPHCRPDDPTVRSLPGHAHVAETASSVATAARPVIPIPVDAGAVEALEADDPTLAHPQDGRRPRLDSRRRP